MTTTPAVGELYARLENHSLPQSGLCGSIFNGFAWADVESCGVGVVGADKELTKNIQLKLTTLGDLDLGLVTNQQTLDKAIIRAGQALGYYQLRYAIEPGTNEIIIKIVSKTKIGDE